MAQDKPSYPSWRQLYRLAATLCEAAGLEPPRSRDDAKALLDRLENLPAPAPAASGAEIPF